jgi:hypothetical protein
VVEEGGGYEYRSESLVVTIAGEALTVNGRRYLIPDKNDSIRVRDENVWINGQPAKSESKGTN